MDDNMIEILIAGRPVRVGKEFLALPKEAQEAQIEEIFQNMQASGEKFGVDKQMEDWSRRHPIASKATKVLQGIPFVGEYTDEALGFAAEKLFGRNRQEATNMVRAMQDREGRENPGQSLALQMGGGVAATLPVAAISAPAKLTSMLPTSTAGKVAVGIPTGAVLGGTEGTVSGYGAGTTPESRMEVAKERGKLGTFVGGVFGAATPLVSEGIKAGTRNLLDRRTFNRNSGRVGLSPDAARILSRSMPPEAMGRHNLASAGADAMLADVGPEARNVLDATLSSTAGATSVVRPAIEQRARAATGKMAGVLDAYLGKPENVETAIRGIRDATKQQRRAIYKQAYSSPIDYASPDGMQIEELMRQVPGDVIAKANRLMKLMGEESQQIMATVADDGSVVYRQMPDVRQLDYITRALNTLSEKERGSALGAVTVEGKALSDLSRDIRSTLRAHVPAYDQALKTAADPLSRIEALKIGEDAFRSSIKRGDFALMVKGMDREQLLAARRGARQYIDDQMAKAVGTVSGDAAGVAEGRKVLRDLSSRASREKMETLLGPRQSARLFKAIDEQAKAFELRASVAQNSKTAQRQEFNSMLDDQARGGAFARAAAGEPLQASRRVLQAFTGQTPEAVKQRKDAIATEVAKALTTARGSDAVRLHAALQSINRNQPLNSRFAADVARMTSIPGAAAGYNYSMNELQPRRLDGLLGR